MVPKVYLVGAGPGDLELLTLKARRVLGEAEVVIYDRLVSPEVLDFAPSAELVSVGKEPGSSMNLQDEINRLMAAHAASGRRVVRLKGGDPFIFGRGGEEAEYLLKRGISVEVIPGVTAASGAAASSVIPLTDRRYSSGVTFVAGQRAMGAGLESVPWQALAALGHTLVFYMGMANMAEIAQSLAKNGMSASMPAAVVSRATMGGQKAVMGTLSDIASRCVQEGVEAPALLIIGEAVSHSALLNTAVEDLAGRAMKINECMLAD